MLILSIYIYLAIWLPVVKKQGIICASTKCWSWPSYERG